MSKKKFSKRCSQNSIARDSFEIADIEDYMSRESSGFGKHNMQEIRKKAFLWIRKLTGINKFTFI